MKVIIFQCTDDLIEQLMTMQRDVETEPSWAECDDMEYIKGIYSQSMSEIKKYHTDYPYLQPTKKFGCWMI
jgi:hypothetical protein